MHRISFSRGIVGSLSSEALKLVNTHPRPNGSLGFLSGSSDFPAARRERGRVHILRRDKKGREQGKEGPDGFVWLSLASLLEKMRSHGPPPPAFSASVKWRGIKCTFRAGQTCTVLPWIVAFAVTATGCRSFCTRCVQLRLPRLSRDLQRYFELHIGNRISGSPRRSPAEGTNFRGGPFALSHLSFTLFRCYVENASFTEIQ